jgi:hypothetical protein
VDHISGHLAHKASAPYASKVAIAQFLAGMGARAVTITAVARTKPADSRAIYKEVNGTQSLSGQTPTNHEWFLGSRQLRLQAAYLLLMYASYRERNSTEADAHGIAFTLAYHNYRRLYPGEALVSPERLALLIGGGYSIGWREIPKGGVSKFAAGNVKVARCRKCALPHLVEAHFRKYECAECQARVEEPQLLAA